MNKFLEGFTSIFNFNSRTQFSETPQPIDLKTFHEQHWRMTGDHIWKQIEAAEARIEKCHNNVHQKP